MISSVMFDFGGVVTESPFVAFAKFEEQAGLPVGFLRSVNASNPDRNAWAKLERSDVTVAEFDELFADESAALGHRIPGRDVLRLLRMPVRSAMRRALEVLPEVGYRIVCLTNNVASDRPQTDEVANVMKLFEKVYESSAMGSRKPERRFFQAVLEDMAIEPDEAVFLDDLGVNLKPARAMGITTIKVTSETQALADLEATLGVSLS